MTDFSTLIPTAPPLRPVDGPLSVKNLIERQAEVHRSRPSLDAPQDVRRQHNRSLAFVRHAAMDEVHAEAIYWMNFNAGRPPARFLGVEGPFFHGKSEIGLSLVMATCEVVWRALGEQVEDQEGTHDVIPAAWIVGGGTTSELEVVARLMHFMGVPGFNPRGTTVTSALTLLATACRRSRTQLIVIDDAHQFPAGRGVAFTKFLKHCFEMLPVTLLFIAKDLDETYILKPSGKDIANQQAAKQLQDRIIRKPCKPIPFDGQGVVAWASLIDRCLSHFVLTKDEPMPGEDILWLHRLTAGNPAELLQTLIAAATDAVGASECITRDQINAAHARVSLGRIS